MSVSSDPTDPNFFAPTLEFLLPWMTKCHKMKVICCLDLLFYDPWSIKYPIIHTCYLFVLLLLFFGCKRNKICWKTVWQSILKK